MDEQQFELMMTEIKGTRTELKALGDTVLAHDRDIRAVKIIGKFVLVILAGIAGIVTFYESILHVFQLRK